MRFLEILTEYAEKRRGEPAGREVRVALFWMVSCLVAGGVFEAFFVLQREPELAIRAAQIAGGYAIALLLMVNGHWMTGRYVFLLTADAGTWYFIGALGVGSGMAGLFAALLVASFLCFSREERVHTTVHWLLCLGVIVHASLFTSGMFAVPNLPERVATYFPVLCAVTGSTLVLVGVRGLQHRTWQHSDALQGVIEQQDALKQRLEHALERINNAVAACPNAIVIVDAAGVIHEHNQEFLDLFGYAPNEVKELSVEQLVPAGLRELHTGHRQAFAQTPSRRRMGPGRHLLAQRKDGSQFPVDIALGPFQTQEGMFTMAVVTDRSAQAAAEEVAVKKTAELKQSNAELTQFAYVASHDLQEPLRMVSGYLDLLREDCGPQLGDDALKYLGVARDGALRMQRLILALLEYSRVGGKAVCWAPVDLQQVAEAVKTDLEALIVEADGKVLFGNLPVVVADGEQIRQALQNLVSNALKFRRSGVPPVVHISAKVQKKQWLLSVKDNGTGIDPKFKDRVFNVFQRLVHHNDVPGEGIGLAVVKKIVDRHHGQVWFESEVGASTTFWIKIPIEEQAAPEPPSSRWVR